MGSTHDTSACGENDGGAEISEQLNLQDRPEFRGVWGKYQEGYNPENARDRDSFLTASFNQCACEAAEEGEYRTATD